MNAESRRAANSIVSSAENPKTHHHLRSHVHLTNNIHLRNLLHMQRYRVLMETRNSAELPLMKELTILRRARSLRDPSTSPAWSSASHGSRRVKETSLPVKDEVRGMKMAVGDISRKESRGLRSQGSTHSTPKSSKREKVDLRGGSHHWVADCFGEETLDRALDQKENHVLKNESRDPYAINNSSEGEQRSESKSSKGKNGRRLNKSRSHPRFPPTASEEEPLKPQSVRRSKGSPEPLSDKEGIAPAGVAPYDGPVSDGHDLSPDPTVMDGERLERASGRRAECGWEEAERRAEVARRVVSETAANFVRQAQEFQLSSPLFSPYKAQSSHEQIELGPTVEVPESLADDLSDEDEISLRHGMQQLSSSHINSQSPLLYRDSIPNSDRSSRGRRKVKASGTFKDGPRHRDGLNLRVNAGNAQGRIRGRRSNLRPNGTPENGSVFGMEGELEVSELPRNGCGMPWYWTRMHKYKGRRFLDIAGRSLTCGFPESSKRKTHKHDRNLVVPPIPRRPFIFTESPLNEKSGLSENSDEADSHSNYDGNDNDSTCSRADAKLLSADRSGELLFGSTRDDLSGILVPTSPAFEEAIPMHQIVTASEEPRSLNQKYRPRSFSELVGQGMVVKSLSNAILKGKIAPVYLFQGPRGTGKTSAARIFAHALNCISDSSDVNRPCGFCKECTHPSPDVREIDAASNNGVESVKALLGSMVASPSSSRCKVFIVDGCHLLTTEAWNAFLNALEEPPWHVVFILITTDPEKIPRNAMSRCQKFLFSKIKEVDIVNRLQILVRMEGLEVDHEALSLIAAQAHGSLRDAEMTLDQLSLLGKHVTPPMVQEMVGLISDDSLIDLLDLALSGDAVSTVRCMRDLLDGGIEPLALVSQLATLITDILAGSVVIPRDKQMRGLFSGDAEEAVRLRQALKILSEAEKQLRTSCDQPTWLTAALLQFAPDKSYHPSSVETSVLASPVAQMNDTSEKETVGDSVQPWTSEEQVHYVGDNEARRKIGVVSTYVEAKVHPGSPLPTGLTISPGEKRSGRPSNARSDEPLLPGNLDDPTQKDYTIMSQRKLEDVWHKVVQGCRSNVLKQLLQVQAFAVAHLEFRHPENKSRAERSRSRICNAFQMALGCPVELQITLACLPSEQDGDKAATVKATSFDDQTQIVESWQREKSRNKNSSTEGRTYRRRHRSSRNNPRPADAAELPHTLYNAVMGDSKGFKPEILPVVGSSKWARPGIRQEEDGAWYRDGKKIAGPSQDFLSHHDGRTKQGSGLLNRASLGKVPLKTAIHQFDGNLGTLNSQAEILCGSSRKKSVKFRDVNNSANSQDTDSGRKPELRRFVICSALSACFPYSASRRNDSRYKTSPRESRHLCWRFPRHHDEDKVKIQRRRRHRRVKFFLRLVPCARYKTHQTTHT